MNSELALVLVIVIVGRLLDRQKVAAEYLVTASGVFDVYSFPKASTRSLRYV